MAAISKSPLQCVLFDWDGTLLDSFAADAQAYIHMFGALGISFGIPELKRHYSPNWHRVYRAAHLPKPQWVLADRLWMRSYRKQQSKLQPGVKLLLRTLHRKFILGLVSSGSRARVLRQLREHQVSSLFRAKVCSEDAAHRKPHSAPLRLALRRLRFKPNDCVYIGDAPEDIEMAHRIGMRAIGVLGGSPVPERLRTASPDALIETIRELPALLQNF